MGNGNYKDGDIPRDSYDDLTGPGYAYYRSNREGHCECIDCKCGNRTNMWLVSIKEHGHYYCNDCHTKHKKEREIMNKIILDNINIK